MPVRVISSRTGQPLTVNALIRNPLVIPERILDVTQDQFIMDRVLRSGGTPDGGAVQYRVSSGLFADNASEIVSEFSEIPLATVSRGDLVTKPTQKRALGVGISKEMRDRNDVGEVERQIQVVRNTLVRDHDGAFVTALRAAVTLTLAAANPWSSASATIRKNINAARLLITTATAPSAAGSFMAFRPDTLIISPTTESNLLNSTEFQQLLFGQVNPTNIGSLEQINNPLLGLRNIWVSPSVLDTEAFVLQSKVVGFYADEVPLEATELYEHKPTQSWRSDAYRTTVVGIDQPLSIARITAV